jgi:hypothetical protein
LLIGKLCQAISEGVSHAEECIKSNTLVNICIGVSSSTTAKHRRSE